MSYTTRYRSYSIFSTAVLMALASASASAAPAAESSKQVPAGPNDPQIAAIVVAANAVDIKNGELALSRSKNALVRELAEQMVTDHSAVNASAVALVTKLKVTPEENETSRSLTANGEKHLKHLRGLKGRAFDKAYVDNEVAYHEAVLKAIESVLIPNAQNAELKAMLVSVQPTFVGHLEHAKHVQAYLAKKVAAR